MGLVRRGLKWLLLIVIILVGLVGIYVLYMQLQYSRIPDRWALAAEGESEDTEGLKANQAYTALTYNIGFGAYSPEFSFFMDSGRMEDGTPVSGQRGRGISCASVEANTLGAISEIGLQGNPDFVFLQEVDTDSTRSYHYNQAEAIKKAFEEHSSVFASNFHSAYLLYPLHEPHGSVNSGILTLSRYPIAESVRRSFPVSTNFLDKFFDLDRCFMVHQLQVENGRELVLINLHMSAYDEGGKVRQQQLEMLNAVMAEEYKKGNYVIVGGDFNHALGEGQVDIHLGEQQRPDWVFELSEDNLADHFSIVKALNAEEVFTCRASDIPYVKGVNYEVTIDGFMVSDNVRAQAQNVNAGFGYSDHNPVLLNFELMP